MTKRTDFRLSVAGVVFAGLALLSLPAAGQAPAGPAAPVARPPAAGEEIEPLTCWWRTSVSAITVGQPFTLVLTCAVIEAETATAIVDRARLDPKAIELAPFEVLGGTVAPDVRSGERTFFQVEYQLRFINEAFFNQDVALPNVSIAYRLQMRGAAGAAATQGMERRYAMPRQSLRVASLVPNDANDIRDQTGTTFADVDALDARGRLLSTSGLVVLALAGVCAVAGVGRAVGGRRRQVVTASTLLSQSSVLAGARRSLAAVRSRVDGGSWTLDDVAQALAAARVVGDAAVGTGASQRLAGEHEELPSGALGLKGRMGTGPLVFVSGMSTPKRLQVLATGRMTARDSARLQALHEALATFTAAQYNDNLPLDEGALSQALSSVMAIAARLRVERLWIVERLTPWVDRRPLDRLAS